MRNTTKMNDFVGLSAVLTGFNKSIIAPFLDPVNMKSVYIDVWTQNVYAESGESGLTDSILSQFASLKAKQPALSDQAIGAAMLADCNSDAFVMACRKLIYLWYMGAWPTVNADPSNAQTRGSTSIETISTDSYTSGLVWQVMQSHPMGDSNYRYGYWSSPPVNLENYTGNGG